MKKKVCVDIFQELTHKAKAKIRRGRVFLQQDLSHLHFLLV